MIAVEGGNPLRGTVPISGAKNAALPEIFASLLTAEPVTLKGVPHLLDVETAVALAEALGKQVLWRDSVLELRGGEHLCEEAPGQLVQKMRASFLVLGPLVARTGRARVPLPGGCSLGPRPVDLHLKGLAQLRAQVSLEAGMVSVQAANLKGGQVYLDFPSVGATEQLLLAGALAQGKTTIVNPSREPEVVDLAHLLTEMGAEVHWDTDRVSILGREELGGAEHLIIPDRIEAGTYLIGGAITAGQVRVTNADPQHLSALLDKLAEAGCRVETGPDWVEIVAPNRPQSLELRTWPYPGFPTDLQPPMVALLSLAHGRSTVTETIYASRFGHVEPLLKMGARIQVSGNVMAIEGVECLLAAKVEATDIRAGAALVLASLAAQGVSFIAGSQHLLRGYEGLGEKLRALGARVWEESQD